MAATNEITAAGPAAPQRLVARWVPTVDERGRPRLVMQWQVPDLDEALQALLRDRG
jgi:tripartite-type tricarboxylate transporter receptor subunit TctC